MDEFIEPGSLNYYLVGSRHEIWRLKAAVTLTQPSSLATGL